MSSDVNMSPTKTVAQAVVDSSHELANASLCGAQLNVGQSKFTYDDSTKMVPDGVQQHDKSPHITS